MGLRISPESRFKLVIVGEGLPYFVRFVLLVIPWEFKRPIRNAHSSGMALSTDFQASLVRQFSWTNDFSLGLGRLDVLRAWTMASFTSDIELDIFGFISPIDLLQVEAGVVAAGAAHLKGFFHRGLFETAVLVVPIL